MSSPINKKTIERLAELARIELTDAEKEKLASDLANILGHFEELQKLDTSGVEPMTGGTTLKNIFREDEEHPEQSRRGGIYGASESTSHMAGVEQFPETRDGFLKIPPVFSAEGARLPDGQGAASRSGSENPSGSRTTGGE